MYMSILISCFPPQLAMQFYTFFSGLSWFMIHSWIIARPKKDKKKKSCKRKRNKNKCKCNVKKWHILQTKKTGKREKKKEIYIETEIQRYILHLRNTYAEGHRWFKKYFLHQRINFLLQNPFDLIFGGTKDKLCTFLCKLFLSMRTCLFLCQKL